MTAPTPDAVAQARKALDLAAVGFDGNYTQCVDALIAAVRAECAAKVGTVADCHTHCLERRANVDHIAALEAEVERLTASIRKLTTMLEEEAYHRMAAESRAEPDGGNVRIEVTDSAEVERLRARFKRYADHDEGCKSYDRQPCNCGFPEAWYATFPDDRPTPRTDGC